MNKKTSIDLDKFYTTPETAKLCYDVFKAFINENNITPSCYIEPSAGGGSFLDVIEGNKLGFDIAPTREDIIKIDFLNKPVFSLYNIDESVVFIGNPPFGKKSDLAIQFLNKCLKHGIVVGFILPLQFRKWSAQKQIDSRAKLMLDMNIPEKSFLFMNNDYKLRCCFQIWSNTIKGNNLRIKEAPITKHTDFEMWQYNRTEQALKYFDYDWDFAVLRQGYGDYTKKYYTKEECDRKKQWIFFKANTGDAFKKLMGLDFEKLSKKNIGIPGFGKADVVQEYENSLHNH
jgi:hypothetical protein